MTIFDPLGLVFMLSEKSIMRETLGILIQSFRQYIKIEITLPEAP